MRLVPFGPAVRCPLTDAGFPAVLVQQPYPTRREGLQPGMFLPEEVKTGRGCAEVPCQLLAWVL